MVALILIVKFNQVMQKISQRIEQYSQEYEINRDSDWHILKLQEEVGELAQAYLRLSKRARTKGLSQQEIKESFAEELADVLGMAMLIADYHKIDLLEAVKNKWFKHIE